jgi:hypothetical protein
MEDAKPYSCARVAVGVAVALLLACASAAPPPPSPGTATAWGFVRLVPREGVTPPRASGSAYDQPGTRGVRLVDYGKPGFVVVYLEGAAAPDTSTALASDTSSALASGASATLRIRDGRLRPQLDPEHAALRAGGTLRVENATGARHSLSIPELGLLRSLGPGEALESVLAHAGEHSLFLLDVPEAQASLFVAPGRFAVAEPGGHFELRDLAPGRLRLKAWHPRFPPSERPLELGAGDVVRVDLELGVGTLGGAADGG